MAIWVSGEELSQEVTGKRCERVYSVDENNSDLCPFQQMTDLFRPSAVEFSRLSLTHWTRETRYPVAADCYSNARLHV